jgi:hypothetical protein
MIASKANVFFFVVFIHTIPPRLGGGSRARSAPWGRSFRDLLVYLEVFDLLVNVPRLAPFREVL